MTSGFAAGRDVDKNLADLVHLGSQTPVYLVEVAGELSGTVSPLAPRSRHAMCSCASRTHSKTARLVRRASCGGQRASCFARG